MQSIFSNLSFSFHVFLLVFFCLFFPFIRNIVLTKNDGNITIINLDKAHGWHTITTPKKIRKQIKTFGEGLRQIPMQNMHHLKPKLKSKLEPMTERVWQNFLILPNLTQYLFIFRIPNKTLRCQNGVPKSLISIDARERHKFIKLPNRYILREQKKKIKHALNSENLNIFEKNLCQFIFLIFI